jgi:leader peptidase (prepilin peptidase)/N-methyltransferase
VSLAIAPRPAAAAHSPALRPRATWAADVALLAVLVGLTLAAVPRAGWPAGSASLAALLPVAAATPLLVRWDLAAHRLPNAIVAQTAVPVVGAAVLAGVAEPARAAASVVGALAFAGLLFVPVLLGGMGMGDAKLAAVLGVAGGVLDGPVALVTVLVAFTTGGFVSALLLLSRHTDATDALAFGPFLLAGFWVAVALV